MNKGYYISKNYIDKFTASSKAKLDVEKILKKNSFKNIGLPALSIENKLIGRIYTVLSNILAYFRMPKDKAVFIQYPVNFCEFQVKRAKQRNNKVIIQIHDINILRNTDFNSLQPLREADTIIAHTESMKRWLIENDINSNVEVLGIFDYLDNSKVDIPDSDKYIIAFAGNLGKSKFLNYITGNDFVSFRLFGIGGEKIKLNNGVEYCGCYSPEELAKHVEAHFGLVWDGNTLDTCNGINGEYLKFISPHKLSMYISAGLPVIVWEKSAMADFVRKHNVGVIISSLNELYAALESLSKEQYERMKVATKELAEKVEDGVFLSNILKKL